MAKELLEQWRVLVPVGNILIRPEQVVVLEVTPQRMVGPPYWLGLMPAEYLRVRDFMIGQYRVPYVRGWVAGEFFSIDPELPWPSGLVPIHGPICQLGARIAIELQNTAAFSVFANAAVWATAPREREIDALDDLRYGPETIDDLRASGRGADVAALPAPTRNRCTCGDAFDAVTGAHSVDCPLVADSDEQWQTPCDES